MSPPASPMEGEKEFARYCVLYCSQPKHLLKITIFVATSFLLSRAMQGLRFYVRFASLVPKFSLSSHAV